MLVVLDLGESEVDSFGGNLLSNLAHEAVLNRNGIDHLYLVFRNQELAHSTLNENPRAIGSLSHVDDVALGSSEDLAVPGGIVILGDFNLGTADQGRNPTSVPSNDLTAVFIGQELASFRLHFVGSVADDRRLVIRAVERIQVTHSDTLDRRGFLIPHDSDTEVGVDIAHDLHVGIGAPSKDTAEVSHLSVVLDDRHVGLSFAGVVVDVGDNPNVTQTFGIIKILFVP